MQVTSMKSLLISLLLACTCFSAISQAEQRALYSDEYGFSTSLRLIDRQLLMQQIRVMRTRLQAQETDLQQRVEQHRFNHVDTLITVALPGGLLYAALKQNNHVQERKALNRLSQDINQLSADLLTFQSAAIDLRIAALN